MSEKAKRPEREDILEVFRSEGDRDISAENYLLKKRSISRTATGPLRKNQITDSAGAPTGKTDDPHALALSGADAADKTSDALVATGSLTDDTQQPAPVLLQTFRIDMQERLAAMQVAQQKAKDQLNELKKQNPAEDEPPAD